jgi:CcmD family protein
VVKNSCRPVLAALLFAGTLALAPVMVMAQQGQPQPPRTADEGFVPIDELPPDEKLPVAPFLIGAYSIAWVVVAGYLFSIWQRIGRVEREIADVSRRLPQGGAR